MPDTGPVYDGEDEHDGCGPEEDNDTSDLEPGLAAPECVSQLNWAAGGYSAGEAQCEDEGFECDREYEE